LQVLDVDVSSANAGLQRDRCSESCRILAVVLDGRTTQCDLVVELPAAEAVCLGQSVLTINAPRLAHADVMVSSETGTYFTGAAPPEKDSSLPGMVH
jgi:hypothetical protein